MKPTRSIRLHIREATPNDTKWIREVLIDSWSSTRVVSRGIIHQADELPGIVALIGKERVGLLTYNIDDSAFKIVTLNSLKKREGVGTALVHEAERIAQLRGCNCIWVITTNDNKGAIKFYQTVGFQITSIHSNAIEESRRLKPEIPLIGINGIPITDEIELEKLLG
ncbi:MAG: GNAT family N-acetyltransferase [Candidatus Thorarchaeota archaeon]